MNLKSIFSISTIFFLSFLSVQAQTSIRSQRSGKQASAKLMQQYSDSLRIYQAMLKDALAGKDSLQQELDKVSSKYMESSNIATPLTYYHGVANRMFGIENNNTERAFADYSMMKMYLLHPELVIDSDNNLLRDGNITYKPTEPVHHEVDLTSQSETPDIAPITTSQTAPVELITKRPNFWKFAGDYSLQFLQNYISSNWYKGGESNYSMIGAVTLQANYNDKEKIKWDNKLEMKLGMQSSQGDTLHNYKSSEDLIRLTSKLGVQATKHWYYTLQGIISTQFTHGYKANDTQVYSDFMSPLNVNLSLGMDYKLEWFKKHLTGTVNISPLATNFKYVDRLALSTRNGLEEGKHSKWDLGSTFTADLTWKFSDLIKWQTRLYGFTSYHRTEVQWENTLTFQLSKYISTKVFVYPRFDDSANVYDKTYGYFQLKEYWSLGFNYSF